MDSIKVQKISQEDKRLYEQLLTLRNEVLRIPIGLDLFKEDLHQDDYSISFVAIQNEEVIGCIMLTPQDTTTFQMRQMAVHPNLQGKGVGTMLVKAAEQFSKQDNKTRICLNGRKQVAPFYTKQGYQVIGEEFILSGITHLSMHKLL